MRDKHVRSHQYFGCMHPVIVGVALCFVFAGTLRRWWHWWRGF